MEISNIVRCKIAADILMMIENIRNEAGSSYADVIWFDVNHHTCRDTFNLNVLELANE